MKINEENFVEFLKSKNEKALEFIIEEYGGLVKGIVIKHIGDISDTYRQEECINDIFMGVWDNIDSFDHTKNSFKNWICGIAKYKSIDYFRKIISYNKLVSNDSKEIAYDDFDLAAIENEIPEEFLEMISCLNEKDKNLFIKIYLEDKSIEFISKETGVKKNTLYSRMSRGRKKIKNNLKKTSFERSKL